MGDIQVLWLSSALWPEIVNLLAYLTYTFGCVTSWSVRKYQLHSPWLVVFKVKENA